MNCSKRWAALRDRFRVGQFQLAVILDEHRVAGWFEEQDRGCRCSNREAGRDYAGPSRQRRFEIALAEGGTAATFAAFDERDVEAKSFENFDRGDADVRFVVADKGIVPKNDFAARPGAAVCDRRIISAALAERRYMFVKPAIETLLRVMRQTDVCRLIPATFRIKRRIIGESRLAFASAGIMQPSRPNKSTLLRIRSRSGKPSR